MNAITMQTRRLSHEKKKKNKLTNYIKILNVLGNEELTAREIKERVGATEMNEVRPRITELCKDYHEMIACGEKYDAGTNRTVALFRRTTKEEKERLDNLEVVNE